MPDELKNLRYYVYAITLIISLGIFLFVKSSVALPTLFSIKISQFYALTAIAYLYIILLAKPLYATFQNLSYRENYKKIQSAIIISTCYIAILHASFSFFGELGGFQGLFYLGTSYLTAVSISFTALIFLCIVTAFSVEMIANKLPKKLRNNIPSLLYFTGLLVIIHAFMLGGDFIDLSTTIPQIFFLALATLLLLLGYQIDIFLKKRYEFLPQFGIMVLIIIGCIIGSVFFASTKTSSQLSFNIHAVHIQLAQQVQQQSGIGTPTSNNFSNIPGLDGDRTKRYTVSFNNPQNVQSNQDTTLTFKVYDSDSGSPISLFKVLYAKNIHMIVVDSTLSYFAHIHPTQMGNQFVITTQFPHDGEYHIYLEFQPFGGIEQQVGFVQDVGVMQPPALATQPIDKTMTKTFGNYEVTLDTHGTLYAQQMSLGQQTISFTIKDSKTHKPITTLKPYLAAFGHLTMIQEKSYNFIHVHPYALTIPPPNANGGPTVDFLPIGIYGAFKPGVYRVFGEFNPDNDLTTVDFTIHIE